MSRSATVMSSTPSLTTASETQSTSSVDGPSFASSCKPENIARKMHHHRQRQRELAAQLHAGVVDEMSPPTCRAPLTPSMQAPAQIMLSGTIETDEEEETDPSRELSGHAAVVGP